MKKEIKERIDAVRCGEVPEGYCRVHPYVIPNDWEVVKLESITKRTSRPNKDGKDRPAYSINNRKGFVPQNEQFEEGSYEDLDKSAYKIVRKGEFAYNPARVNVGSIGRLRDAEEVAVSSLYVCVSVDDKVDGEYFDAWTKSLDFYKETVRNTEGSVREYLFYENFSSMRMPIPSRGEQQKIAEILETCDRVIELKQQLVEEYKKTKKVFLRRLFPLQGENVPELRFPGFKGEWKKCRLGELSDFITKGATPTTYGYHWEMTGIPFFRNDSIQDNRFVYGEYSFISEMAHKALSRSEVKRDDILIAITGDIGKVGIVPQDVLCGNINQHIARVRIIKDALPFFVYQYLCTATMQNNYQVIKTGISMPQLSLEQIRNTEILLPSMEEQQCIAACLKNLDEAIELHLQELEEVQRQKRTMMQLLLTGLVRVNA